MTEEQRAQIHAHIELEKLYIRDVLDDMRNDKVVLRRAKEMLRVDERELTKGRARIEKLKKQLKGKR